MTSIDATDIELAPPYRVNGQRMRFQSLWLLLRIYYAQRTAGVSVSVATVQARFPGNANVRMTVSRAFADFRNWGIDVGWGHERSCEPALLNPARRSQGPFWMDAATAARLRLHLNGVEATPESLAHFLGLDAAEPVPRDPVTYVMQDITYWNHLTQAMRVAQDGFPVTASASVAESFRAAQHAAQDGFQLSLALLKESLAWRKHGHSRQSQKTLGRLDEFLKPSASVASIPTISAMAFVARGWNYYTSGKAVAAQAELERLATDPALQPVVRYNPRVRFEYLNLRALIHKGMALNPKGLKRTDRMQFATQAIADLSDALQAAYEADSIDAAQDVAANIGLTMWLCWQNGVIDPNREQDEYTVQTQALRWLGLSEWICDRFGVGGNSAWNTIFLLRIARGSCQSKGRNDIDHFRAQSPLKVEQVIDAVRPFHAPFSKAKGYGRWSTVAAFVLEEHDTGRTRYGALQIANLLLEYAWFSAHERGLCKEAYSAAERLTQLMMTLQPKERSFFRQSIKSLPEELQPMQRK
ncbi:hypothetical protein [Noviherbaspirillum saxi]|uniref:Uncharacterized protein n=1 Tax=Noviherbaspirillum saxi TaxID=2320863 RepID=A0A3A3FGW6_9BURK|nr:hypothetical protein [Noviherbaspirillum saxi]RJF91638.1 hypothetical protein D3871_23355 [Noviherbaspirillum saxi]